MTKDEQTEKAWYSNGIALHTDVLRLLKKFNIRHSMYNDYPIEIWELKNKISTLKMELKAVPQDRANREKLRKKYEAEQTQGYLY